MFAAKSPEALLMDRLYVYAMTGLAVLAIAVLVWLILRIRSWFFDSDDSDVPLEEMLTQFRQLKREGELTAEEYRLISQRLSGQPAPVKSATVNQPATSEEVSSESSDSTDPKDD